MRYIEKPPTVEAFYFGSGFADAKQFIMWANERSLMAAYVPDLEWQSSSDSCGQPAKISEIIYIRDKGYIKGAPNFTMELPPQRWFVIRPDGQPWIMTDEAFKNRYEVVR